MSLSSQNKKKKKKKKQNKRKTRLKYGISFSQFTNMKNIHPKKLIQIKSSNTFKIPSKYKSQTY